jgi:hypothetical protein
LKFKGFQGSDGECWTFEPRLASGNWDKAVFLFSELLPVVFWGNQHGAHKLDTQAVRALSFLIPGSPGKGQLQIRSVRIQP